MKVSKLSSCMGKQTAYCAFEAAKAEKPDNNAEPDREENKDRDEKNEKVMI